MTNSFSGEDVAEEAPHGSWPFLPWPVRPTLRRLLDLVYPAACPLCRRATAAHHALCPSCWRDISFITAPCCDALGLPFPHDAPAGTLSPAALADPPPWRKARAVARHGGAARALVHALKFADRTDLARLAARMMLIAGAELIAHAEVIAPVPLHRRRLWSRRYNQAATLSAELAGAAGLVHLPSALRRVRRTAPQVGLSRKARARNLRGAIIVAPEARTLIAGRRVLLVDDVMTTGATAAAASRALKRAGAVHVDVLTFALAIRE